MSTSVERCDNPQALRSDFDTTALNSRRARNFRFWPASRPLMKPCRSSASGSNSPVRRPSADVRQLREADPWSI